MSFFVTALDNNLSMILILDRKRTGVSASNPVACNGVLVVSTIHKNQAKKAYASWIYTPAPFIIYITKLENHI